jgi:hypothetical protein
MNSPRWLRLALASLILAACGVAFAADPKQEVLAPLDIYRAGHLGGQVSMGIFLDNLSRDEQAKMAREASELLNGAYEPKLTLKGAEFDKNPKVKGILIGEWMRDLEFKSKNMMPHVVIRGLKQEGGKAGHIDVTHRLLTVGAGLGALQRLTRDPTKKLGDEYLMEQLTYRLRGVGSDIKNLSEKHSQLKGLAAQAKVFQDTFNTLAKDQAYKKHRVTQYRGLVDDANDALVKAIKALSGPTE